MFQNLKNIISTTQKVYAIDVETTTDGNYHCLAMELARAKGAIDFVALQPAGDISLIPAKAPVCLVLNGKGIIHRKITVNTSITDADIIRQIIPNANPEEFYVQKYEIAQSKDKAVLLVSLARKSFVDKMLADFRQQFQFIVDISISPFILDDILPAISGSTTFQYKNIVVHTHENKVQDFAIQPAGEEQTINIAGKQFSSVMLPALSLGFSFLLNPKVNDASLHTILTTRDEYLYKNKIQIIGKTALFTLFGLLIINFLVFDHYYKKTQQEQPEIEQREEMVDKLKQLKENLALKSRFLEQAGLLEQNRISFYLDRLASTIPAEITLTDVQVNPLADPNKKESYNFRNGMILISGISNKSTAFNEWIKKLKSNNEITENVSILNYDHEIKTGAALFTIEIAIP